MSVSASRSLAMLEQVSSLKTKKTESSAAQNKDKKPTASQGWTPSRDKMFEAMKAKFSKNPKSPMDKADLELIKIIADKYIAGGGIFYYKKLAELLDICFNEALKTLPKDVSLRTAIDKSNWMAAFPFVKQIEDYITQQYGKRRAGGLAQQAFNTFKVAVGKDLPADTLKSMDPGTAMREFHTKTIPLEHRKGKDFDYSKNYMPYSTWFDAACAALVTEKDKTEIKKLEEELEKLNSIDQRGFSDTEMTRIGTEIEAIENKIKILKKEKLINDLKSSTQEIFNAQGLYGLLQMYGRADFEWLGSMPEFAFQCDSGRLLYPDIIVDDIFPGAVFRVALDTLVLETRKEVEMERKAEAERGRKLEEDFRNSPEGIFASKSRIYRDAWRQTKTQGVEPGFLLRTPEGRTGYAKTNFEAPNGPLNKGAAMPPTVTYYASSMLSHLGIKMAEPTLMGIKGHGFVFQTEDLSRTYKKAEVTKKKKFSTMDSLLPGKKNIWGGNFMAGDNYSKDAMDKFLMGFKDPTQEKTRVSFAKLMLATTIFGLSDVFDHGGNIGIIETEKNGKKYQKFGLVDFGGGGGNPRVLEDLHKGVPIGEILTRNIYTPIYKEMAKCISPEEFRQAAAELASIKKRELNPEGYLVVKEPKGPKIQGKEVQVSMQRQFDTIMFNLHKEAQEYNVPKEKENAELNKLVKSEKLVEDTLKGVCEAILEPKASSKPKH